MSFAGFIDHQHSQIMNGTLKSVKWGKKNSELGSTAIFSPYDYKVISSELTYVQYLLLEKAPD